MEIIQIDSIAITLIQILGICSAILFPSFMSLSDKGVSLSANTLSNVVGVSCLAINLYILNEFKGHKTKRI